MLRFEFGRIGLQYLLVISGFHFAILVAFVSLAARQILSSRKRLWALLFAISTYFLFVGNSPPVLRSFLASAIFLIGQLLERRTGGLNILGACLLIEVISDPVIVRNIGFQLSFLSCFGIFLFHSPIQQLLEPFFPCRQFGDVRQMALKSQCGYLLSSFFSRALNLTIAVNLALGPLLLFHFHRFPFLSLVYNLFTPAWTALSLFLLLASLTTYAIFPLFSLPLFKMADLVAGNLLELIGHPPAPLDCGISFQYPAWALAPYIIIIFFAALHYRKKTEDFL
jgi:competence protein ComEC